MSEQFYALLYKLRFVLGSTLIIACLFLLSFILSITTTPQKAQAATTTTVTNYTGTSMDGDPNVVSQLMTESGNSIMQVTSTTQKGLSSSLHSITTSIAAVPVHGAKIVASSAQTSAKFVSKGAGNTFAFMARLPGNMVKVASPSHIASATIRPADNIALEKITAPKVTEAVAEKTSPAPAASAGQPVAAGDNSPQWPIHGVVTTLFGVNEWPYEAVHTGLDISDGKAPGTTPIHPFKPGRVVQVIHSNLGLGNHVVIDHGGGLTSVYGHMNSIAVQVGQQVDKNSLVGYEGTTGASTGPHLHFEIRVNGIAENPFNYVPGKP